MSRICHAFVTLLGSQPCGAYLNLLPQVAAKFNPPISVFHLVETFYRGDFCKSRPKLRYTPKRLISQSKIIIKKFRSIEIFIYMKNNDRKRYHVHPLFVGAQICT